MSGFLHYVLGYAAFALGAVLYLLGKIQEYKDMAESNPDPKIIYNTKRFINKELINFVRLFLGGIALVVFMPALFGDGQMKIENSEGIAIISVSMKSALIPLYFVTGLGGTGLLFSIFGKYRKTLLTKVGVDENK